MTQEVAIVAESKQFMFNVWHFVLSFMLSERMSGFGFMCRRVC